MQRRLAIMTLLFLIAPATTVFAADVQDEIKSLKDRLAELEAKVAEQKSEQLQREEVKKLIAEATEEAPAKTKLPSWLQDLNFKGDLRLRYEGLFPEDGKTRNRGRFRLRFGVSKTLLDDQLLVAFRLASGDKPDATSTNQTFTDFFSEKEIWIDQAYVKYTPDGCKGLALLGGKIPNPWVHTDLVWDSDVNPEAFVIAYTADHGDLKPFANAAYGLAKEESSNHDVTLGAYQIGMDWQVCEKAKWTTAITYYDYDNLDERFLDAGAFRVINLTNKVSSKIRGLPVAAYFDWVYNCGDDDDTPGQINQNHGYAAGVKLGANKNKGDWSAGYKYAYIELNSTPGIFNDSDFGGSNRKGHVIKGEYNLARNVILGGAVFLTEDIVGPARDLLDTLVQADLIVKF